MSGGAHGRGPPPTPQTHAASPPVIPYSPPDPSASRSGRTVLGAAAHPHPSPGIAPGRATVGSTSAHLRRPDRPPPKPPPVLRRRRGAPPWPPRAPPTLARVPPCFLS
ncbi:hypothetical protein BS78_09G180100 [Paspalum vaginatum]|nr:hypothetical protein BS78_09G180100 [Paspalum vaginatum]